MRLIEQAVTKPTPTQTDNLPDGVLARVRQKICNIGKLNRNRRRYSWDVWDKVLNDSEIQHSLKNRSLFMQEEHPEDEEDQLTKTKRIAGVVTKFIPDRKNNELWIEYDILDTPYGRIIDTLRRAGCGIGVSTRADGEVIERIDETDGQPYYDVVPESYQFYTVDFTPVPSTYDSDVPETVKEQIKEQVKVSIERGQLNESEAKKLLKAYQINEEDKDANADEGNLRLKRLVALDPTVGFALYKDKSTNSQIQKNLTDNELLTLARKTKKRITLSGDWSMLGKTGWGETVDPDEFERLLNTYRSEDKETLETKATIKEYYQLLERVSWIKPLFKTHVDSLQTLKEELVKLQSRYSKLQEEKQVVIQQYANQVKQLEEKVVTLRKALSTFEATLNQIKAKYDKRLQESKKKQGYLQQKLVEAQKEADKLRKEVATFQKTLASLTEKRKQEEAKLLTRIQEMKKKYENLQYLYENHYFGLEPQLVKRLVEAKDFEEIDREVAKYRASLREKVVYSNVDRLDLDLASQPQKSPVRKAVRSALDWI